MKTAIFATYDYDIPFEKICSLISEAGFDAISFGCKPEYTNYTSRQGRDSIRKCLEANDLSIDSLHAPFPEGDRLFSLDEEERAVSLDLCKASIEAAGELDGKIVVTHLIQPYDIPHGDVRDRMIDNGRDSISILARHAEKCGVKLALENGQKDDYDQVVRDLLAEFNTPSVGLCYDVGHENVRGACFKWLEDYADRLFTVHIHDNDGTDTHLLPFEGSIDWDAFRRIFHSINYSGNLLLECSRANSQFKDSATFAREAKKAADKLVLPLT